ncbi:hypothetical protein KXD40_007473 [Peronospora effusa]|nr:hypothetical protein KXD40_007473 [Peronospora effusa]
MSAMAPTCTNAFQVLTPVRNFGSHALSGPNFFGYSYEEVTRISPFLDLNTAKSLADLRFVTHSKVKRMNGVMKKDWSFFEM